MAERQRITVSNISWGGVRGYNITSRRHFKGSLRPEITEDYILPAFIKDIRDEEYFILRKKISYSGGAGSSQIIATAMTPDELSKKMCSCTRDIVKSYQEREDSKLIDKSKEIGSLRKFKEIINIDIL